MKHIHVVDQANPLPINTITFTRVNLVNTPQTGATDMITFYTKKSYYLREQIKSHCSTVCPSKNISTIET